MHKESSIKIYFTNDYSKFRMINGNRQLNQAKIRRIENDILKGLDVLRYCPILVQEKGDLLEIIDGQHRFWVCKKMKSKVWYIVVEDFSLLDIAKINSNTEKWKNKDYVNCYVQQDNQHYVKLDKFMQDYGVPLSMSMRLLMTGKAQDGGVHENVLDLFKRGRFEVKFEQEAIRIVEACKLFETFDGWNSTAFITAIFTVLFGDKCDFAELVEKFNHDTSQLQKKGSAKEYLTSLEEIYNYRMRSRRVIY